MRTLADPRSLVGREYYARFYSDPYDEETPQRLSVVSPCQGYWAKKVRGKFLYFGKIANDPRGEGSDPGWQDEKDDLLAGRTPRINSDSLTVADLCNHFLTAKSQQVETGEIKPRTFRDYHAICKAVVQALGKNRRVEDLAAVD